MPELLIIGDLVVDLLLEARLPVIAEEHQTARSLRFDAGGAGTTILAARNMGLEVAALGAVGDDLPGRFLLEKLSGAGVNVDAVQVKPGSTTTTVVAISDCDAGGHVFLGRYGQGASGDFDEAAIQRLMAADAVFLPGYALLEERLTPLVDGALAWLADNSQRITFDVGPFLGDAPQDRVHQALRLVDVLLLTEEEIAFVGGDIDSLLAMYPRMTIVLKLGERGCRIVWRGGEVSCPGFSVPVVDSIGAGDAFAAAWIWADLQGYSRAECGTIANAMGAASVTRPGAGSNAPAREDVQALLDAKETGIRLRC